MQHQAARAIALEWVEQNTAKLTPGAVLQFAWFEHEDDAQHFLSDRTGEDHNQICQCIGRIARRMKLKTDRVTVRAGECPPDMDPTAYIAQWPRVIMV